MAHSSICEQCHVDSRRRKLNTDLFDLLGELTVAVSVTLQLFATVFTIEPVPAERQDPVFQSEDIHILRMRKISQL